MIMWCDVLHRLNVGGGAVELIVIDERRIKLMLSAKDMEAYRAEELASKELLRGIMRDACRKCGYEGAVLRGRVYVEMYPSRAGGCELFITRLAERESVKERETVSVMKSGNEAVLAEYRKYIFKGRVIYSFESMKHLLCTCRGLMKSGYVGESTAYRDDEKMLYYLMIEHESPIAVENLGTLCRGFAYYYINEHCRMLCTGAVATLGNLA